MALRLATILLLLCAAPATAQGVTPADDGYHYAAWADGAHDATYTEWWYFNVVDSTRNVRAIFSYFVSNPDGLLGPARIQVVSVAYTGRGTVSAIDAYPAAAFSASPEQADVAIGPCTIEVLDPDTYRIAGASLDGRLAWNLLYVREASSWFAAEGMPVGRLDWERMSWLVYMPRARVSGTLTVDGQVYDLDASGYHDHNWGEWIPTDALWSWAQYSNSDLAFELGDFRGQATGLASIDTAGERTVFTKEQYAFTHTRWAFDRAERVWYPIESLLVADDGTRRLRVAITVVDTVPLRGDLAFPLPDLIIFEQTARYEGWLWTRSPDGRWLLEAVFGGEGFTEYTAKHY
jgi:hypothetical protein